MPKQREGFNFYRSYYDVFKMLSNDKDKVQFIKALLEKQFEGKEPKKLTGQSKFAYVSQQHSINKQVEGWESKNKCKLSTLAEGGAEGGADTPTEQVQVQVQGEVQVQEEEEEEENRNKKPKVFSSEVQQCYDDILNNFEETEYPDTQKLIDSWKDTIDKLNRIDGLSFDDIRHLVQKVKQDDFWKGQFQSINKLRKRNKDGVIYWKYFLNKFKNEQNAGITKAQQRDIDLANW